MYIYRQDVIHFIEETILCWPVTPFLQYTDTHSGKVIVVLL